MAETNTTLTIEALVEAIKNPENEKVFIQAAKQSGMIAKEEFERVRAKQVELLGEKKNLKAENDALKKENEDHLYKIEDLESNISTVKVGEEEITKLKQMNRDIDRERKKWEETEKNLTESLDKTRNNYYNSNIDRVLDRTIKSIGVLEADRDLVRLAFRSRATVEEIDDKINIHIKDENGTNVPIEDFFKNWSVANPSKIKAAENSGGGALGGQVTKTTKTVGSNQQSDTVLSALQEMFK